MFSDEIKSVMAALGVLAGKIGEEEWELVRMARRNLEEVANRVQTLESECHLSTKEIQ